MKTGSVDGHGPPLKGVQVAASLGMDEGTFSKYLSGTIAVSGFTLVKMLARLEIQIEHDDQQIRAVGRPERPAEQVLLFEDECGTCRLQVDVQRKKPSRELEVRISLAS